jgi:hypothetical protein
MVVVAPTVLARTLFSSGSYVVSGSGVLHSSSSWSNPPFADSFIRAYSGAARANINWQKPEEQDVHASHTHMIIFVQPHDESNLTYVVDNGWGGSGLARPIPLLNGDESTVMGLGPAEEHRLSKTAVLQSSLSTSASFVPHISYPEPDS